ncbi:M28 family peptidase [Geomonas paludis]|uniref:M28 family peptidase n=1 Tax=Geomonas paludis TaxID=2740185 RepID=A0A6V8MWS9_9BACT|nr:M28 family peptidase [Geomonas paludis]UPU35002.1 M28 family peptidase [Geomonas paludis]GFO64541.1 peptidase M28 [Geomonas paludis]
MKSVSAAGKGGALPAVSRDRIEQHLKFLEGVRHPVAAPAALQRACTYLEDTLRALGYAVDLHGFADGGEHYHNVVATRLGTRRPEKRVLVLAHFDTVAGSPGADDNASGVALLLELATIFKEWRPELTLQFVGVNLEENPGLEESGAGLRGSSALAALAAAQGWEIEAVVVLESVAFAGTSVPQGAPAGVPLQVPPHGDFLAVIGNEVSQGLVTRFALAVESFQIALPVVPLVVPGNGELLPDTRRSDHAPFWDAGYPAIMLTDTTNFRNPHYHHPSDTVDTLNLSFALRVCQATAAFLLGLTGWEGEAPR